MLTACMVNIKFVILCPVLPHSGYDIISCNFLKEKFLCMVFLLSISAINMLVRNVK